MKLKRFNNINENEGDIHATDKQFEEQSDYGKDVDMYIPLNSDPAVRAAVKKATEDFKWEPDEIIAMCYGMLVEINEHDMAKDFVALAKKHH